MGEKPNQGMFSFCNHGYLDFLRFGMEISAPLVYGFVEEITLTLEFLRL